MSCTIIDAEIYGMMPSAKIAMRSTAPPANMLNMPRMPWDCCSNAWLKACRLIPGSGMYVPSR
jgi:hypothetical protein